MRHDAKNLKAEKAFPDPSLFSNKFCQTINVKDGRHRR